MLSQASVSHSVHGRRGGGEGDGEYSHSHSFKFNLQFDLFTHRPLFKVITATFFTVSNVLAAR